MDKDPREHFYMVKKDRNRKPTGVLDKTRTACGQRVVESSLEFNGTVIADASTKVGNICKSCLSFTDYQLYRTVAGGTL